MDEARTTAGAGRQDLRPARLTIARTLKIASSVGLLAFVALILVSFLSLQSIDGSFEKVVSVDQPSQDAATDMITAADAATIAFLQSLVSGERQSSEAADIAFRSAMETYEVLVRGTAADELGRSAHRLFDQARELGGRLVDYDQSARRSMVSAQERFERMDDTVEEGTYLSSLEEDVAESARWFSNYFAAPSAEYAEESVEEVADFVGELIAARDASRSVAKREKFDSLLVDALYIRRQLTNIISLTERSQEALPHFLSIRSELDRILNDGIGQHVQTTLKERSANAQGNVRTSKSILIGSLGFGAIVGLMVLFWVNRRITRPVERLMRGIKGLGSADSGKVGDLARNDEFGVLARGLSEATDQRKSLLEELRRQALTDPLTGLANRDLFKDRVEAALAHRDGRTVAVAFLDLDDFKSINDSLGHAAGDELLATVAARVKDSVSTSDTVARLGGDEFAVLLHDVADVHVPVRRLLDSLNAPIELDGNILVVGGSIGIAIYHDGQEAGDLLRNADVAMYRAKAEGKGSYRIFEQTMHSAAVHRFELKNELVSALSNGEFILHYQPVMHLASGRRTGVEALLRWEHPDRGLVSPADFIPLAEETGAIVPIGRWVLETACAQVARWRQDVESSDLRVCVNVSPNQLKDSNFIDDVGIALANAELPAEALVVEITENSFLLDGDEISSILVELAELGVVVAIDDFGAGYTSLGYLGRLPVGIIKIDRSFVTGIDEGPEGGAIAQAIILLGESLGMEIIAEGIETESQLAELKRRGCGSGQGFLLGRPCAPEASEVGAPAVAAVS